ncbi:NCS2 family permease [Spiroplasma monobiae]|uniref:Xanthine/uracil permease n=1 Tax=Spiroplasma monobiae MQ-1 TaxID=1336748 RepID=A0A2K9LVI5_SPISQ|nr:NCS2 family permease [Spiroplasma monobiae]AUM63026.1 xanthine/uracil permease [Spiroplasma monobiae MQ-1]
MNINKKNENNFEGEKSKDALVASNSFIAKFFKFSNMNTTFKKEIIGGISTFLSMLYILSVEPQILAGETGANSILGDEVKMNINGVFLATALMSFLASFIMGLSANVPISLAPSMGVNAMFTFSVANHGGIGFEGALIATFISGLFFCIISVTKLRKEIMKSMPKSLHLAIGVGIGFFVAYVGLSNIGWVDKGQGVPVAQLGDLKGEYPAIILGTIAMFVAILLSFKKFFAPVAVVMLIGFIIAIILANSIPNSDVIQKSFGMAKWDSSKWDYNALFYGFAFNISSTWKQVGNSAIWTNPTMYISIFVFLILTFFDATGTITAVNVEISRESGIETEIPHRALMVDGGATIAASLMGVSNVGSFAESCVGISQGARTGFASIITSIGFLISIAIFPIFQMMPSCITGAATVFIGTVMIKSITGIEWEKPEMGLAAFFSILLMVTTYNISNGIAFTIFAYTVGSLATGKVKQIHPVMWVLNVVFILYFVAHAFL